MFQNYQVKPFRILKDSNTKKTRVGRDSTTIYVKSMMYISEVLLK